MRFWRMALVLFVLSPLISACQPALLRYTIRVESEPPGAKIYDPRTDEVIGETPYEVPVEYQRNESLCSEHCQYIRKQSSFDQYTPQDPTSKGPHVVTLNSNDRVRLLVVKEGFEKLDQTIDWYFSEVDGQVVKKRVFLRPIAKSQTSSDDVYR